MDFFASYSRPVPDASQTLSGRENNFIQIKEKNMYYYQILKNQKNKINTIYSVILSKFFGSLINK